MQAIGSGSEMHYYCSRDEAVYAAEKLLGSEHSYWNALTCVSVDVEYDSQNARWVVTANYRADASVDFSDLRRMAEEACRQ